MHNKQPSHHAEILMACDSGVLERSVSQLVSDSEASCQTNNGDEQIFNSVIIGDWHRDK